MRDGQGVADPHGGRVSQRKHKIDPARLRDAGRLMTLAVKQFEVAARAAAVEMRKLNLRVTRARLRIRPWRKP